MHIDLRDYFAAKAMQGLYANPDYTDQTATVCAQWAYELADAMLAAGEAGKPEKKVDGGWIEHISGFCPVRGDTQVEVRFRDNETARWCAREFFWDQKGLNSDIIAYRVVQP